MLWYIISRMTCPIIILMTRRALVILSSNVMLLVKCKRKSMCVSESKSNAISIVICNVVTNPSIVSAFAANFLLAPNSKLSLSFLVPL